MLRSFFWTSLCLISAAISSGSTLTAAEPAPVDFGRQIQPLLSENCFFCHGPDAKNRKADLRLDTFEGATAGMAVKPGDSQASELVARILSTDPEEQMPPPSSNRKLTDAQKQLLKRWIDEGAKYTRHWAFVAPVRPAVPATLAGARILNPIDAFLVSRLVAEGLPQAAEADKGRLLRRVSLDLTGLPPTPEEVAAFVADPAADAYTRAVDRLLASPRYGERMVWEWLDAARYADTNGYQGDPTRAMWYWRDWAIDAFNQNLPYDQFTIQQLAGDLLPNPTRSQLIATGFHRNHMINGEGGRIVEESRVEYVQDRVETTGTVWMGLTLTCCRCHDHKYDPFTQKQYYQLAAYFNSIDETGGNDAGGLANPVYSFLTPAQEQQIAQIKIQEQEAEKERAALQTELLTSQPAWDAKFSTSEAVKDPAWQVLKPVEATSSQGATLKPLDDGSLLASDKSPEKDEYTLQVPFSIEASPTAAPGEQVSVPAKITGLRLEALPDDSLKNRGPGRAAENGNFVLNELTLLANAQPVELAFVSADFSQQGWEAAGAVDGKPETGWGVLPEFGKPHELLLELKNPLTVTDKVDLTVKLAFNFGGQHTLGRYRVSVTTDSKERLRPAPASVRAALAKASDQRSEAEKKELAEYYLNTLPELVKARQKQDGLRKQREAVEKQAARTMVMRERAQPRETFILEKGAYNAPGEKVEHGVLPQLLQHAPDPPKSRLALATWLTSPDHPLTARVAVNRIWQQFFGVGLVKSSEDFGVQGDKPSHPELLDWLAVEFRESGWDVKHLVRLIVTSAAYQQSSKVAPGMAERDPQNRLLSRGPRLRLPSWMLRDQALAVSGLLVEKTGGPPVKGYQPEGIWEEATFGNIKYAQDHGEALYRRSLYIFWRRIVAPTLFFDVANRQNCSVKSSPTNTPLHALVTLNDITFVEAARALAQRTLLSAAATDDVGRIGELFLRCTARPPRQVEVDRLAARLATLRMTYATTPEAAQKLLTVGESKPDPNLPAPELAAWTGISLLVLNLDETLNKD